VIHNQRTPLVITVELTSNQQNFMKLWLQLHHTLPHLQ